MEGAERVASGWVAEDGDQRGDPEDGADLARARGDRAAGGKEAQTGWAQESILSISQIEGWDNYNTMPFMIDSTSGL